MENEELTQHLDHLRGQVAALTWMCAHFSVLVPQAPAALTQMANEAELHLLYSQHSEAFREGARFAMLGCAGMSRDLANAQMQAHTESPQAPSSHG